MHAHTASTPRKRRGHGDNQATPGDAAGPPSPTNMAVTFPVARGQLPGDAPAPWPHAEGPGVYPAARPRWERGDPGEAGRAPRVRGACGAGRCFNCLAWLGGGSRDFLLEEAALWQLPVGDGGGGGGRGRPPAWKHGGEGRQQRGGGAGRPFCPPPARGGCGDAPGGRARAALTSSARRPPRQRGAPRDAGSGRGDGALPTRAAPCSQQGHQPKNKRPRRACSSPHCQHSPFPVNVLPGTRRQAPGPSPRSVPAQASPGPQPPPARCPPSVPAARSDLTASAHPLLRPPGPTPRSGRTEREFPSPTGGAPRIWPAPHRGVSLRRATRVPGPHSAAPRPQGASSASRGSRGRPSCCGVPAPYAVLSIRTTGIPAPRPDARSQTFRQTAACEP